ncbi:M20/M25/M40 family metallo-hydrolase [Thermomicrobiaceae bacterium CFH 74404]|uniref:M20/M25/M40 family metallo-hydrolase n=1 Tax=Thermalbibacter longus TaxID=2951981 RepID=A0AA42BEA8_9BACT|nr:M20/M25/M40 family metallo-hydrolase [Thermalbibacter longus]MCM8750588.1 M20/M25/M40 family metallo-hydrolase [Thermalbibacter longus]
MDRLEGVRRYVDDHAEAMIADLQRVVRQPSVSATGEGVAECARLLVEIMAGLGIEAEVVETDGQPLVLGRARAEREDAPALLVYCHYDVQPPDPLDAWEYPPFEARRVGDRIVGRGTTDAKGNLMALLQAVGALRATGGLPVLLTFLFDGEEESGSPSLPAAVERLRARLQADAAMAFDGGFDAGDIPRISLGTSGLLFVQLRARGAAHDLHSARARLVPNPAWRLVWALATMKTPDERVQIEGFYDRVRPPTEAERALLERAGWDDEAQRRALGVERFIDDLQGIDALERLLYSPTCNIAGFSAGYAGEGSKTVLPATATVNLDFRLVCDQDPEEIARLLRQHLDRHGFADVEMRVLGGSIEPSRTPPDAPIVDVTVEAARQVYGREPRLLPTGDASGREATWLANRLGIPGVQTGIGPPAWRGHAPNEFITVRHYLDGICFAAAIWLLAAERLRA